MIEIFYNLLPVLFSFLLGLVVYLVKAVLNISHKVLELEIKIGILIKEVERISDKKNFKN